MAKLVIEDYIVFFEKTVEIGLCVKHGDDALIDFPAETMPSLDALFIPNTKDYIMEKYPHLMTNALDYVANHPENHA